MVEAVRETSLQAPCHPSDHVLEGSTRRAVKFLRRPAKKMPTRRPRRQRSPSNKGMRGARSAIVRVERRVVVAIGHAIAVRVVPPSGGAIVAPVAIDPTHRRVSVAGPMAQVVATDPDVAAVAPVPV